MLFSDDYEVIFKLFKVEFRHALELFARGLGLKLAYKSEIRILFWNRVGCSLYVKWETLTLDKVFKHLEFIFMSDGKRHNNKQVSSSSATVPVWVVKQSSSVTPRIKPDSSTGSLVNMCESGSRGCLLVSFCETHVWLDGEPGNRSRNALGDYSQDYRRDCFQVGAMICAGLWMSGLIFSACCHHKLHHKLLKFYVWSLSE